MKFVFIVMVSVSSLKIFKINLNFFNFFASVCPYFSLCFHTFQEKGVHHLLCLCMLAAGCHCHFLILLRQDEFNQTFLRNCLYHCSRRMADNRSYCPERPNRKRNFIAIMQCSHGKSETLCLCCYLKQRKIHLLTDGTKKFKKLTI